MSRCYNKMDKNYKNYGGRGIVVCDRWRTSFQAFLSDMGERPAGHSLDRKDNSVGYEPKNCRWATRTQQNRNKRTNCVIEFNGEKLCVSEWAERFCIRDDTLRVRLKHRSIEKALMTPTTPTIGSGHPAAKLNEDKVVAIRARHAAGELVARLANDYGVNRQAISNIVARRRWKHVP